MALDTDVFEAPWSGVDTTADPIRRFEPRTGSDGKPATADRSRIHDTRCESSHRPSAAKSTHRTSDEPKPPGESADGGDTTTAAGEDGTTAAGGEEGTATAGGNNGGPGRKAATGSNGK